MSFGSESPYNIGKIRDAGIVLSHDCRLPARLTARDGDEEVFCRGDRHEIARDFT